ncbi:hypothetical protein H5410_057474, partial [Solanum commersonii]
DYHISTIEQTIPLESDHVDIKLLNPKALEKYSRKYNYLHFGLVQIVVKPLSRKGLDTSLLLCLRDSRFLGFNNSLLGMVETSLCSGPIFFDCFPNFTVSLKDINILDSLTLNVKTSNYKTKIGSLPVAIIYRIQYKGMSSAFNTGAMRSSYKGETIQQFSSGTISISFQRSLSQIISTPSSSIPPEVEIARHSVSSFPTRVEAVNFYSRIPQAKYYVETPPLTEVPDDQPQSPTYSSLGGEMGVLTQDFQIDK